MSSRNTLSNISSRRIGSKCQASRHSTPRPCERAVPSFLPYNPPAAGAATLWPDKDRKAKMRSVRRGPFHNTKKFKLEIKTIFSASGRQHNIEYFHACVRGSARMTGFCIHSIRFFVSSVGGTPQPSSTQFGCRNQKKWACKGLGQIWSIMLKLSFRFAACPCLIL